MKIYNNDSIENSKKSLLLSAPTTSIAIERSFSILNKVVTKEINFNDQSVIKYIIRYYNNFMDN